MANNQERVNAELPKWFRIGDGDFVVGVYPEEDHVESWPTEDQARILYGKQGTKVYFPSLDDESQSLLEEEIRSVSAEEAWLNLCALDESEELHGDFKKGYDFARLLIGAGDRAHNYSFGLAVSRAVSLCLKLRGLEQGEKSLWCG